MPSFSWLEKLIQWARVCTGKDALANRLLLLKKIALLYQELGADTQILEEHSQAPLLHATFKSNSNSRVLLFGHIDTVFETTHPFQSVWIEGTRLRGPGVCDMKSGVMIMYESLKRIRSENLDLGWSVIINSDEEIGSAISAPLWEKLTPGHLCALGFEPSITTKSSLRNLAKSRMGSTNFRLHFKGKSAHAGRNPEEGASAIHAACRWWTGLEESLKEYASGLRINIGKIQGGEAFNIVADSATLDISLRIENEIFLEKCYAAMDQESKKLAPPLSVSIETITHRPPKPATDKSLRLAQLACLIAQKQGIPTELTSTAGVCDGNNIQHTGIATLDNLGAVGGGLHSDLEWVDLPSIEEQIKLVSQLLTHLAQQPYL